MHNLFVLKSLTFCIITSRSLFIVEFEAPRLNKSPCLTPRFWKLPFYILCVLINLTTLGTSQKWNWTIFAFFWWTYFTGYNVLNVFPRCSTSQNSLFVKCRVTLACKNMHATLCLSWVLLQGTSGHFPLSVCYELCIYKYGCCIELSRNCRTLTSAVPYPFSNAQEIPISLPPCQHLLLSLSFLSYCCRHPFRHKAESHCGYDLHLFSI